MTDAPKATEEETRSAFWDLLEEFSFAMMVTHDAIDGRALMRGRPMAHYLDREGGVIRFLSERTGEKVEELAEERDVLLSYAQPGENRFASVSGRASLTTDRATIERLWGPAADMWFEGDAQSADVVVIEVRPTDAEYWRKDEGPLTRGFELVKGLLSGERPDIGANAKIEFNNAGEAA